VAAFLCNPDDSDRAANGSDRRFELVKWRRYFHKILADVVGLADKSIDLVELAVDDKVGGLTYRMTFCVET